MSMLSTTAPSALARLRVPPVGGREALLAARAARPVVAAAAPCAAHMRAPRRRQRCRRVVAQRWWWNFQPLLLRLGLFRSASGGGVRRLPPPSLRMPSGSVSRGR